MKTDVLRLGGYFLISPSLSLFLFFNLLLFSVYIFFLYPFPSSFIKLFSFDNTKCWKVKRIDGAAWRENKRRKDLFAFERQKNRYVRGSCLTRSISSIGHRFDPRSRWHDDETKIDERSFFLVREKFRNLIGMILRFQVCYNDSNKGLINRIEYVMK